MTTTVILFGATGDLAQQKLFPALLRIRGELPLDHQLQIVAIGRRPYSRELFLAQVEESLQKNTHLETESWQHFRDTIFYYQMDFTAAADYSGLREFIQAMEAENGGCNRLFHLSVSADSYALILDNIHQSHLQEQSAGHWRRILIEKPFGHDANSARELNQHITQLFSEDQIYRIDHYLGKETVQNVLAFRFANRIFEPLWNNQHIDHIQITVAEAEGIKTRGAFYDQTGAFRDIVQNHILQLLTLLTMNEPADFSFTELSNQKAAVLAQTRSDNEQTVFGQYRGYLQEDRVNPSSETETYAMTCFYLDSERWKGVPIYVRTGKKLAKRITEVSVQFKKSEQKLFKQLKPEKEANLLTFRIQPDEGISLELAVKTPRESVHIQPIKMEFCYATAFRLQLPDAYERLFLDALEGSQALSLREDLIELSWKIIDPLLEAKSQSLLEVYDAGSWGPLAADQLLEKTGRRWLTSESQICNGIILE